MPAISRDQYPPTVGTSTNTIHQEDAAHNSADYVDQSVNVDRQQHTQTHAAQGTH